MSAFELRRRLLVWRRALLSHAGGVRAGVTARDALADDLCHMAQEAAELAVDLLSLELDGPAADGPAEVEAMEEDEFSMADTQPILPLRRPKA